MEIVRYLFALLTARERRNMYLLFGAMVLMAGLEVVSVASIMPFLSVAADPANIKDIAYLAWAFETFGFQEVHSFLIALGLLVLGALIVSNGFIVLVTWLQYRFVWNRNHSISRRLLRRYLLRPYEFFLTRNSSDLSKNILEEAREVTYGMLLPALRGIAKGLVALAIVGFLIVVNPVVALVVAATLGGAYGLVYVCARSKLEVIGTERVLANQGRYQAVNEAFGAIKEVKLRGKEEFFVKQFDRPSKKYARSQTLSTVIAASPRYILEAVAFGGIILMSLYFLAAQNDIRNIIPMLGLYAFAGYRLMPALQRAFQGFAKARFNKKALVTLYEDLYDNTTQPGKAERVREQEETAINRLELENELRLDGVTFTYPTAANAAIRDVCMTIAARSTVGIVGRTGSGKTTMVDLILGLLQPDHGHIQVDGMSLNEENIRAWRKTVDYVPQEIYLADDTIARNVAFGLPEDDVDYSSVKDALCQAQILEFVMTELPNGLDSMVGERGIRLSGGQRQRIGIARALYRDSTLIVFDEATSALDQATEQALMDAIYELGGRRTIILVSHRHSTVKRADTIFVLEKGRVAASGRYERLVEASDVFREMSVMDRR